QRIVLSGGGQPDCIDDLALSTSAIITHKKKRASKLTRSRLITNAKLPDSLRLSGLHNLCNLLNLHVFVGRIMRSRRIRHEQ
ncbi:hypothetical protein O5706_29375, partial [Escherichia coli]|nr:hypothetical protein [Escherichia coli]